jgi:hypothetical protein
MNSTPKKVTNVTVYRSSIRIVADFETQTFRLNTDLLLIYFL